MTYCQQRRRTVNTGGRLSTSAAAEVADGQQRQWQDGKPAAWFGVSTHRLCDKLPCHPDTCVCLLCVRRLSVVSGDCVSRCQTAVSVGVSQLCQSVSVRCVSRCQPAVSVNAGSSCQSLRAAHTLLTGQTRYKLQSEPFDP